MRSSCGGAEPLNLSVARRIAPEMSSTDSVVHTWEEAIFYLGNLREQLPGCPILIQEFLTGPEYSVGIIRNPGSSCRMLPILEVDYSRLDPALPRI